MIALLLFTMLACMPGSPPVAGFPVTGIASTTTTCDTSLGLVTGKKGHSKPQSGDSTLTGCQWLYNYGHGACVNYLWQQCYDTLKKAIETCPLYPQSWRAFFDMRTAVQSLASSNLALWVTFHNWLESVLYLNTSDPEYFCQCVESLPFVQASDTTVALVSKATNRGLAVLRWLLQNTTCDTPVLWREYEDGRGSQRDTWLNDINAYPLDTTLPSMADLGLDTLLARHFQLSVGASGPDNFASIMPSFSVSDNPFEKQTTLRFTLNKAAYIRIEVFDQLGREVFGDGTGRVLDPGPHETPIDGRNFASGTYYLRISLGTGEVRTIKLIRE